MKRKSRKPPVTITSFRLPDDIKQFIERQAAKDNRSRTYVVVEILRMYKSYVENKGKTA